VLFVYSLPTHMWDCAMHIHVFAGYAGPACISLKRTVTLVVQSAAAAGMKVYAVPSILDRTSYKECECTWLPSLLAFNPADHGMPPFDDLVAGTVPLDVVWRLKGPVVKGFGRGSRVCNILALLRVIVA
jgi:hypothetical protein